MSVEQAWWFLNGFNYLVLFYFFMLNNIYLIMSVFAFVALRRYSRRLKALDIEDLITSTGAPSITLIAPAYNEEVTCVSAVRALMSLHYPEYEILVINDGSRDATFSRLSETFSLAPALRVTTAEIPTMAVKGIYRSRRYPNLWVIDKENGGKADTLNCGLNYCRTSLYCAMDADCLLERDALIRIVRPFLENSATIATGGMIRIVNDSEVEAGRVTNVRLPRRLLARFQVLEYFRAFFAGRIGWATVGATLVISGAFGLFKRSIVVAAGGYSTQTVGEDMELVVRLHRYCRMNKIPYDIGFVPDPIAWTEVPESIRMLARQRDRWQRGLMESLSRHRGILFNPRYGKIGFLAYPYFYFFEMFGPIIELCGYITFLAVVFFSTPPPLYIIGFLAMAFVYGIALSISAVALEELTFRRYPKTGDLMRLFVLAVLENIGYRQLLTFWRFKGVFSSLRRLKEWGRMERKGFEAMSDQERKKKRARIEMKIAGARR